MNQIPDFTETELWVIRTTLKERYGKDIEIQLGDAELRLSPEARTLTPCPTVFWSERGANFAIFKLRENRYRCQFFYRGYQQFGTGRDEYADMAECVSALLQVQSDHEREQAGMASGRTGAEENT